MKFALSFLLFLSSLWCSAQDSLGTVHFYRVQFVGFAVNFRLYHDSTEVGKMAVGEVLTVRCKPGFNRFHARTESTASIELEVKAGYTYYVECGLAMGVVVGTPTFRQVSPGEARKDLTSIGTHVADALVTPDALVDFQSNDTARAVTNLFARKRKGGKTRAIVFGTLGFVSAIGSIGYADPANFVFIGFCAVMTVTGVGQNASYNELNLKQVLADFDSKKVLPPKVKAKMKAKDFD